MELRLKNIKINMNDLQQWLEAEELPEILWQEVKDIDQKQSLVEICTWIRRRLFGLYGDKRDTAKSFADSRFTSMTRHPGVISTVGRS